MNLAAHQEAAYKEIGNVTVKATVLMEVTRMDAVSYVRDKSECCDALEVKGVCTPESRNLQ